MEDNTAPDRPHIVGHCRGRYAEVSFPECDFLSEPPITFRGDVVRYALVGTFTILPQEIQSLDRFAFKELLRNKLNALYEDALKNWDKKEAANGR